MNYEVFISYSRKDNVPQKLGDATGWVSAFRDKIPIQHHAAAPLRFGYTRLCPRANLVTFTTKKYGLMA